jgi:O-antigen ligase
LAFVPLLIGALRVGSDPRFVRQFLWTFFWMGVLTVAPGIAQLSGTQRLTVLGANTIGVGRAALLVPLLGVLFVLRQRGLMLRAATIVLIPAAIVVALATGSRGPILALLALGLVGAIRQFPRMRSLDWRLAGVIGGLALVSVVAVSLAGPTLPGVSLDRFGRFGDFIMSGLSGDQITAVGDTSAGARVDLFGLASSMFAERPVLGFGTAGFEATSPRFLSPLEAEAYPHNAILQFASEYGIVGVTIFAAFVLPAMTRRFPPGSLGGTVRVVLLFFLLNAMVSGDIFSDRASWGLLLLVLFIEVPRVVPTWGTLPGPVFADGGLVGPSRPPL